MCPGLPNNAGESFRFPVVPAARGRFINLPTIEVIERGRTQHRVRLVEAVAHDNGSIRAVAAGPALNFASPVATLAPVQNGEGVIT